jgi:hypothetical protein
MLEQIRRLGKEDRERLWEALADQWHEEISRALTCRLAQRVRPAANEMAEPLAASPPVLAEGDNRTEEARRREALNARATPSHPDVGGGPVQVLNGPFCERVYAIGSVEWAEQQRRRDQARGRYASCSDDAWHGRPQRRVSIIRRNPAADLLQVLRHVTIDSNQGCGRPSVNLGVSIG